MTGPEGNRRTVRVILGIMAVMALVGLTYALYTAKLRQSRHPYPKDLPPPVTLRAPADLAALGHVPSSASIVAGMHIGTLLDDPAGKALLAEAPPAIFSRLVRILEQAGVAAKDVDHVAAALLDRPLIPAVLVIVRTREPYDLEKLAKAVQPARISARKKRPLYELDVGAAGEAVLWGADDETLIFAASPMARTDPAGAELPDLLAGIPEQPSPKALSPSLQRLIDERLARRSQFWIVGAMEQSGLASKVAWMRMSRQHWFPKDEVKRFAIGVYPEEGLTMLASFFTGDVKASERLQVALTAAQAPEGATLKIEGPPPAAIAEDQWITVQIRAGAASMRKLLGSGGLGSRPTQ
jgi:hypothetical protein